MSTEKQRQNGRKWCGYAPGRYSRKTEPQPFSWWAEKPVQADRTIWQMVAEYEAKRIKALPAPYVSREME